MGYINKAKQNEYCRLWCAKRRAEFLKDKKCVKCGSKKKLELDHIKPEDKISHNVWSWKESRRLAEIAKCQILCNSCHKEKTALYRKNNAQHGTTMYATYHCRCVICVTIHNTRNKDDYRRKKKLLMEQGK